MKPLFSGRPAAPLTWTGLPRLWRVHSSYLPHPPYPSENPPSPPIWSSLRPDHPYSEREFLPRTWTLCSRSSRNTLGLTTPNPADPVSPGNPDSDKESPVPRILDWVPRVSCPLPASVNHTDPGNPGSDNHQSQITNHAAITDPHSSSSAIIR